MLPKSLESLGTTLSLTSSKPSLEYFGGVLDRNEARNLREENQRLRQESSNNVRRSPEMEQLAPTSSDD